MDENELFEGLEMNDNEVNVEKVGEATVTPVSVPEVAAGDDSEVKPLEDLFPEENKEEEHKENKKGNKKDSKKTEVKKEEPKEEPLYEGPRTVKAYGQVLFVEENPKVTLDEIRERVVLEHNLTEFTKAETEMYFNKENGIVIPRLKFNKKG